MMDYRKVYIPTYLLTSMKKNYTFKQELKGGQIV